MLVADAAGQWLERRRGPLRPRLRRALSVLGVVAAEFPDSDLVYSGPILDMGPLGYLLHHRGHTHTLVWAVFSALLLWVGARWWLGRGGGDREGAQPAALESRTLLTVALAGTLSHILLDWTNSYGVHPFWPLNGRWYYGDAVFIVEPWLWLIAIPALYWNRPSRGGKLLLALCFGLILAAVLFLGQVARDVTIVLLLFAVLWPLVQRHLRAPLRTVTGVATWALVTVAFFASSARAEVAVREAVTASATDVVLDVVLTPAPGDWGCWSALVMSRSDGRYRVTSAFVAPFESVRPLATCAAQYRTGRIGSDVLAGLTEGGAPNFVATPAVGWRTTWSAPLPTLASLVHDRCEVDAALHFMRAPVWQQVGADRLLLSDARFGVGGGGFSELTVPATGDCTLRQPWIPGWVPPRADLFE